MATREAPPPASLSSTDESRYRKEVLQLEEEAETEDTIEERLVAEAAELGLQIPNIQIAASLAATINAGILDFTIPAPSSSSSSTAAGLTQHSRLSFTHPQSFADLVRTSVASVDRLASSLSETTVSDRVHSGSVPSIESFSTRPTSVSSCDIRIIAPQAVSHERLPRTQQSPQQTHSPNSPASTSACSSALRLSERKRSSFINAIGRPFRKRRTPSSVNLPPNAHISLKKNETGGANTVVVETKAAIPVENERADGAQTQATLQVEVPVFDEAALNRTIEDAQLKGLFERHKAERSRFLQLQNELLESLKAAHLAAVEGTRSEHHTAEIAKKEWNTDFLARMEERQLSVEIEQIKDFEISKRNSQTRIKYMEGYVSTASAPPSPQLSDSEFQLNSSESTQQPLRTLTRRQKEQLAQEYLDRNSMDRLHEARIKVLRERQEQQLQETTSRLEKELANLISENAQAIADLEHEHQTAEQEMLQAFDAKKNRLRRRWNIEEAILRKRLEDQTGLPYGPLPIVSFSGFNDDTDGGDHDFRGHRNNDPEFLEFEIPMLKNPFSYSTRKA